MEAIWDQPAFSKPPMDCADDVAKYTAHHDQMRLIQFLMALIDDFESCRASLLHQILLPTLEVAVSRLLSDETRLSLLVPPCDDAMLAIASKNFSKGGPKICRTCNKSVHILTECSLTECHKCKKRGHVASHCPTKMDCHYCKLSGHSIEQFPTHPLRPSQTTKATIPVAAAAAAAAATDVNTSSGSVDVAS